MLDGAEKSRNPFAFVVVADLSLGVGTKSLIRALAQQLKEPSGDHEGDWQKLRGLVGGKAIHHALVASAACIHTQRNIRGLLFDQGVDRRTADHLVAVVHLVPADAVQHLQHQRRVVRLMGAGKLARDDDVFVLGKNLDCHAGILVMPQAVGHNSVRNLVCNLVGMAAAYLFASNDFHSLISFPPP